MDYKVSILANLEIHDKYNIWLRVTSIPVYQMF